MLVLVHITYLSMLVLFHITNLAMHVLTHITNLEMLVLNHISSLPMLVLAHKTKLPMLGLPYTSNLLRNACFDLYTSNLLVNACSFNFFPSTIYINHSIYVVVGPVVSVMCHRFSYRSVVIWSGLVLAFALIISGFAPNIYFLFVSYGVIGGNI